MKSAMKRYLESKLIYEDTYLALGEGAEYSREIKMFAGLMSR